MFKQITDLFENTALNILRKQVPFKEKPIKNNQSAFIIKKMRKAIKTRSCYELLFRHIFETQIRIQTQIRKTFILALASNDFL